MKKTFFVLCVLLYVFIGCTLITNFQNNIPASTNCEVFAQISTQNACFFKSPSKVNNHLNVHFLLEQSHFVIILDDSLQDFYHVSYFGIEGYVEKENLTPVNEQISHPFLDNITFQTSQNTFLYSFPKINNENQTLLVPSHSKLTYIGKIYGDEVAENSGNVWYYSKFSYQNNEYFGYIHSLYALNLTPITHNIEVVTALTKQEQPKTTNLLSLNLKTETILTIVVSLPIIFALFLFLKGYKKLY